MRGVLKEMQRNRPASFALPIARSSAIFEGRSPKSRELGDEMTEITSHAPYAFYLATIHIKCAVQGWLAHLTGRRV